jgi:sulfite reductase (ferredoxin)
MSHTPHSLIGSSPNDPSSAAPPSRGSATRGDNYAVLGRLAHAAEPRAYFTYKKGMTSTFNIDELENIGRIGPATITGTVRASNQMPDRNDISETVPETQAAPDAPRTRAPSAVEATKIASRGLRGMIAQTLDAGADHFAEGDQNLLKFHGVYQGYDRDTATARKQQKQSKDHRFMVRVKIPAGRLTPDQYLALDDLAGRHGGGNLRITTRQGLQFHGLVAHDLKATIGAVNAALLSTLAACGDVVRNVTATPAPIADAVHYRLAEDARFLSAALAPRTRAYHEIWVDGELTEGESDPADELYGAAYLPRKFKIGLATPQDNSIDVLTNDLGIIALFEGERLAGYNLAVGGGLGMTHNKPRTYPRLATPIAFVGPDELLPAVRAVIRLQRDHGDRSDRKHARLKYLVDELGVARIKELLDGYFGAPLEAPRPMPPFSVVDHMGWHPQGDGRWYFGVPVASGRIVDHGEFRLRSGLRAAISELGPTPILTPTQDILLADIPAEARDRVEVILRAHGVTLAGEMSPVRRWALACPALPSCGLALTEAERVRDDIIADIEQALTRHGLAEERLSVRITGCPNGCARPYSGDIGIVGRMPGYYALYVGGDFEGTRLSFRLFDRLALGDIARVLEPMFEHFARHRRAGEGFGDFCHRHPPELLRDLAQVADTAGEAVAD